MPYTPDPDDSAQPTIVQLASSAALEFRTLKDKINQLFTTSAINILDNTIGFFKGFTFVNSSNTNSTLIAFRGDATRTGGTASIVAGTASAVIGNNVSLANNTVAAGFNAEMWTSPINSSASPTTGLFGQVIGVVQQNPNGQIWSRGLELCFYNRAPATAATIAGLGANLYNKQATALSIVSQPRGTEGAMCGWVTGLRFENYCLDEDNFTTQHPTGVDFTGLGLTNSSVEPSHFNFSGLRMITAACDNAGTVNPPTKYQGFIRVSIDGNANYAIPVCHLPL